MDSIQVEIDTAVSLEITQVASSSTFSSRRASSQRISKDAIRTSLKASTADGIFGAVFSVSTGGVLLGNFLVELGASPVLFGLVSSIPMLVNLFQPMGAYLSERSNSRFQYSLRTYGISRLLWLILVVGITIFSWGWLDSHQLVVLSLLILLGSHFLGGLGNASWLSWIAILVPRRLRGRYFGLRNSLGNLTELVSLSLTGLAISHWYGGPIQGYGVVLLLGVIFGIISLGCQYFQVDINPQLQNTDYGSSSATSEPGEISEAISLSQIPSPQSKLANNISENSDFLVFLVYFGLWTFAVNLSAPFFNLYLLDTLNLDVSWVTFYNSLRAGAHMLMLLVWGKLADKVGNRSILIFTGILIAIIPWLWLGIGSSPLALWLWLPLLHIFIGSNWGAVDLCTQNLRIEVAPLKNQSIYFAIAAAIAGVSGALGATIGGFVAQFAGSLGIAEVFVVSGILRLVAILPLILKKHWGK
ncbi:MFS transporter [Fortiea contorta]|uniref:MFS transporter n=1 Tax=Fortiea contorta TaxID=1892405 RepID=UPI00034950D9|nr:MFS transporter [Fortiea contorta]